MGMTLRADRDELRRFVACLFPYADSDTFAALRGFDQFRRDVPPPVMGSVRINGDLNALVDQAWRAAQRCANAAAPIVFAPPICTFTVAKSARGGDLADGLVLSVELDDGATLAACARLERLLGPCTVVVASGGDAVDPLTGELSPKLHLHWRLSEPTRDAAEHAKLRLARDLACRLAGGDPTGKSVVHPLRWPGSWNCKAEPRMARITAENPQAEIHLGEALERLTEAVEAAGLDQVGVPRSGDPQSSPALVASAMAAIPNAGTEVHYDTWIRLGYGCFRASGGAGWGRDAWEAWSKKSDKFDAGEQDAAWRRIGAAVTAAPAKVTIGAGTIFFMASAAGWTRPKPQPVDHEPPADPDGYWDSLLATAMDQADAEEPHSRATHAPTRAHWDIDAEDWVEADLPLRPWLAYSYIMRGAVTLIGGSPGVGKSLVGVAWSVALALGKPWGRFRPAAAYRVMLLNCEDNRQEQRKRFSAALRQFDMTPRDIAQRIIRVSPAGSGAILAWSQQFATVRLTDQGKQLLDYMRGAAIDVLMLDPFVELHGAPENDNTAIRVVLAFFRQLAVELNIAVVLVHHAKKGDQTPGDPDIMRGASSIVGAIRAGFTVCHMNEKDAGDLGVSAKSRRFLFRIDFAKENYAPADEAEWMERIAYTLDNDETTAAAVPWTPPESRKQSADDIHALVLRIGKGSPTGEPWSPKLSKEPRSVRQLFSEFGILPGDHDAMLARLLREHGVINSSFKNLNRHVVRGLRTADGLPAGEWQ